MSKWARIVEHMGECISHVDGRLCQGPVYDNGVCHRCDAIRMSANSRAKLVKLLADYEQKPSREAWVSVEQEFRVCDWLADATEHTG